LIQGLLAKIWSSKVAEVSTWAISRLPIPLGNPTWEFEAKKPFGSRRGVEYIIRGKVMTSLKSGPIYICPIYVPKT